MAYRNDVFRPKVEYSSMYWLSGVLKRCILSENTVQHNLLAIDGVLKRCILSENRVQLKALARWSEGYNSFLFLTSNGFSIFQSPLIITQTLRLTLEKQNTTQRW